MRKETYNRSRLEILHYILQFSTLKYFGDKADGITHYDSYEDVGNCFKGGSFSNHEIQKDSLCVLSACHTTKWYMSWCLDVKEGGDFGSKQYLMKSIEDGELMWWHNVSVFQYPKSKTDELSYWKWEDSKYDLWDKWKKAFNKRGYFSLRCLRPVFNEDGSVTLNLGERWCGEEKWSETHKNWRRLTQKTMLEFIDRVDQERLKNKKTKNENIN